MADDELVFRNPGRKSATVVWVLLIALGVFVFVGRSELVEILAAVEVVAFVGLAVLNLLACVRCGPTGVTSMCETGQRRRLSWDEIDHFEQRGLRGVGVVVQSKHWSA